MDSNALDIRLRIVDRGVLKAFADVTFQTGIGEVTIQGFRIVQVDGKPAWVGFPQSSFVKDGKPVNKPILDLTRAQHDRIAEALMAEYRRALGGGEGAPSPARKLG